MGNRTNIFDPMKQRLDVHELMLWHQKNRLSNYRFLDTTKALVIAHDKKSERDIQIAGTEWLTGKPKSMIAECKTEYKGGNLLCLEIAANLPDWPPGRHDKNNFKIPAADADAIKKSALDIPAPVGEEKEHRGLILTPKPDGHLFASWNRPQKIWTLWDSKLLCEWVRDYWKYWDVCYGLTEDDYGKKWHSICVLIPNLGAQFKPGLVAWENDINDTYYKYTPPGCDKLLQDLRLGKSVKIK